MFIFPPGAQGTPENPGSCTARPGYSAKKKAWSLITHLQSIINMADDELAAIRAKRMEELQSQYGVCPFDILAVLLIVCLINSFVKYRVKMQRKCNNSKRL